MGQIQYFERRFGLDSAALDRALRLGLDRGGSYAEAFLQHKTVQLISYEDGRVSSASVRGDLGAGLRVLTGDQTGYAYTEELSDDRLDQAAAAAATIASGSPTTTVAAPRSVALSRGVYPDRRQWDEVAPPELIALTDRVGRALAAADPDIVKANVRLLCADETVLIANSEGVLVEEVRPMTFLFASCVAERAGRRESNSSSRSGRAGLDFYTDQLVDELVGEVVDRTLLLFDAAPPPAGEMPVVLAPATSGILLHEAVGHGFEADFNRKGTSIYSTMMGKEVCSTDVTIVDDGLVEGARGALQVDDEGVPGQRTVLVDRGRLVSYMHDRISAAHYGVDPTGNGRRQDFRFPPLPRMRVTTMLGGPHDPEEIIRSVDRGLYVHNFGNGEVSIGSGDYSFYVKSGYLIEEGKLTRPVKDANLIGNGPDSLSKVTMVGRDAELDRGTWTCGKDGQGVPVGLGLPTVLVSSITVGGVNR